MSCSDFTVIRSIKMPRSKIKIIYLKVINLSALCQYLSCKIAIVSWQYNIFLQRSAKFIILYNEWTNYHNTLWSGVCFFFIIMLWEFKLQYMQVSCPWEAYVELKVEHKSVEMVGLWFCSFAMIYDERN